VAEYREARLAAAQRDANEATTAERCASERSLR
jgi:hypothetical protein